MVNTIEKLLVVQDLDCRILRIEKELRDIPARKAEIESRLDEHRKAVEEAKEAVKGAQAHVKQIELEIETRRQRIQKLRDQQVQLKTNKEFQAMDAEIRAVEAEISGIEDKALEAMVGIDATMSEVRVREADLRTEAASVKEEVAGLDVRARELQGDLDRVSKERQSEAVAVDPEWLSAYDRIFKNRKGPSFVRVENGVCGGCHMTLPPYLCHAARRKNAILLCEFCGRMIC